MPPELHTFLITALASIAVWRCIVWVRDAPVPEEPWGQEIDRQLQDDTAQPVCPRCLEPFADTDSWCPHCHITLNPWVNLDPYLFMFSVGELLRNGVSERFRIRPLIVIGYFIVPFAIGVGYFISPTVSRFSLVVVLLYWFRFCRHLQELDLCQTPGANSS